MNCTADIYNDGSHPERPDDDRLAPAGTTGEVVNVGRHAGSNTPIYLVEFPGGEENRNAPRIDTNNTN